MSVIARRQPTGTIKASEHLEFGLRGITWLEPSADRRYLYAMSTVRSVSVIAVRSPRAKRAAGIVTRTAGRQRTIARLDTRLGTVAQGALIAVARPIGQVQEQLLWDGAASRVTNDADAKPFLQKETRKAGEVCASGLR